MSEMERVGEKDKIAASHSSIDGEEIPDKFLQPDEENK